MKVDDNTETGSPTLVQTKQPHRKTKNQTSLHSLKESN